MVDWTTIDWAEIVSIIGIVGTWITILLVFFTLLEMRNQRKASQKPDLILPKSIIYGYAVREPLDKDSLLMITNWSDREIDVESFNHVWPYSTPIKLYNVGFGVAKNIVLRWIVGYDKTIKQIKDYCSQNSVPIILEMHNNYLYISRDHNDSFPRERWPPISLSPSQFEHDFLMPASISNGLESHLPHAIYELSSRSK